MAHTSLLRSTLCILRRQKCFYNTPQLTCRIFPARYNNFISIAKYSSDNGRLTDIEDVTLQPKMNVKGRALSKASLIHEAEEQSPFHPDYVLPSQLKKQYEDVLFKKIVESKTAKDIFELCQQHGDVMSTTHLLEAIDVLNDLVVEGNLKLHQYYDLEPFADLCQRLLKASYQMDVNQLLTLLKCLCRLEVEADSRILQTVLQLLRHNVNDIALKDVVFLNFILYKLPKTPLSEGIIMAIPLILEKAVSREPLGELSYTLLQSVLSLCIKTRVRCTNTVIQELSRRDSLWSPRMALSLLWSLCDYNKTMVNLASNEELVTRRKLIKECLKVMENSLMSLSPIEIKRTVDKIRFVYAHQDISVYSESFFNATAEHCFLNGFNITLSTEILTSMLRMNYLSEDLVNHTIMLIRNRKSLSGLSNYVYHLVTAIADVGNSNPYHLEALDILLNDGPLEINKENCVQIPALALALNLISVGYYHEPLLKVVTSNDFLEEYMNKYERSSFLQKSKVITERQLLQLNQALRILRNSSLRVPDQYLRNIRSLNEGRQSNSELEFRLLDIYQNSNFVMNNVVTDDELCIDHLIVMDEENNPIDLGFSLIPEVDKRISNLDIPTQYTKIAIMNVKATDTYEPCHTLKRFLRLDKELLEATGFVVVPVLQSVLNRLLVDEKNLYIQNLINNSLK